MDVSYWISNVGTFEEYIAKPLHWRLALRRKVRDLTRDLRGRSITGHPKVDKAF